MPDGTPYSSRCYKDNNVPFKEITYSFSDNKLIKDDGTPQELMSNVTGKFILLPDNNPNTANAVRVDITVASSDGSLDARSFSSTYEFKNRLIKRN